MTDKMVRVLASATLKLCGLLVVVVALAAVAHADEPVGVPEIDPASIASAMTLLVGGLLMFSRGRRKD